MLDKLVSYGLIELRFISDKNVVGYVLTRDWRKTVDKYPGADAYFGCAPRGRKREVLPARCLWADVDFKNTPEPEAREALALFSPQPSYIVSSGGGLHVYWLLADALGGEELRATLMWIATEIGADRHCAEGSRILRVPGTKNWKYAPPRLVEIEEEWPDRIYESWEFGRATLREENNDRARVGTGGGAAMAKGRAWLRDHGPAIEGSGGDNHTYAAACRLVRDLGLSEDDAVALLEEWNMACEPPWTVGELRDKARHAARYGQAAPGRDAPESDFEEVLGEEQPAIAEKPDTLAKKMNGWFSAVDENGKLRVFAQRQDEELGRKYWVRYQRRDFLEVCKSVLCLPGVVIGQDTKGNDKSIDAGAWWLDYYKKKPRYVGVTFAPEYDGPRTPSGKMNLWRGFAVAEAEGDWSLLRATLFETLCCEDAASFEYVMNWMARAAQRPWEPGQVALVLKGRKGNGKSTFGRAFTKLFGRHGMTVASQSLLAGRFNAHLRDVVALFADEAFWAGDKAGEGILKSLVTERAIAYEGKGRDAEMGRNCVHLVMASNNDWVVPAGLEHERRFAVFEIDKTPRLKSWWDRLWAQLEGGGFEAMLWELRRRDVVDFDVFKVPQTEALAEQRAHSMQPAEQWLLWCADNGWDGVKKDENGFALAEDLYSSFRGWCKARDVKGHEAKAVEIIVATTLKKMLPEAAKRRKYLASEARQRWHFWLPTAAAACELLAKRFEID